MYFENVSTHCHLTKSRQNFFDLSGKCVRQEETVIVWLKNCQYGLNTKQIR